VVERASDLLNELSKGTLGEASKGASKKSSKGASKSQDGRKVLSPLEVRVSERLRAEIARAENLLNKSKGLKQKGRKVQAPKVSKRNATQSSSKQGPAEETATRDPPSSENTIQLLPKSLVVQPLDVPQPPVPYLSYGLDRVLFNPGIYSLQDPSSRVYNFDPYLEKIMPVNEFDFSALKQYKTSSQDTALARLAQEHGKKYIGSTSSMTTTLSQFHFCLSRWRPINTVNLSKGFMKTENAVASFTKINRTPAAIFLRYKDGCYAIDVDKEYDSANVLMLLGKSLELLLTLPRSKYEIYRKSDPRTISEVQKSEPESYQYTTMGDFLMRSQLDAYDHRLPGNGTFDLKTRAVLPIRMDAQNYHSMKDYEIKSLSGTFGSYEREMYDMMRATMLKYMLQVRMGRMAGIFVAYHNVQRMFGFQYLPLHEMDLALHGQTDPCLGDQEFKASLELLNIVLEKATTRFPETSLRVHFEATEDVKGGEACTLNVFAEPMSDEQIDTIQSKNKAAIAEAERIMMEGLDLPEEDNSPADNPSPTNPDPLVTEARSSPEENAVEGLLSTEDTLDEDDAAATSFLDGIEEESSAVEESADNDQLSPSPAPDTDDEVPLTEKETFDDDETSAISTSDVDPEDSLFEETSTSDTIDEESVSEEASVTSESDGADEDSLSQETPENEDSTDTPATTSDEAIDQTLADSAKEIAIDNGQQILFMKIKSRNIVNGSPLERPTNLRETDEWRIDYELKEYDNTTYAWAEYQALKSRRKTGLDSHSEDADPAEKESQSKRNESYHRLLRELVLEGRKHRVMLDKLDAGKEKVLYENFSAKDTGEVDSVESYMDWLYGPK
jgi:hypothetical protein